MTQKTCLYCGCLITNSVRTFCNTFCSNNYHAQKASVKGKCVQCGKDFVGQVTKKYCSPRCRYKSEPKKIPEHKFCSVCGERFFKGKTSRESWEQKNECSPKCRELRDKQKRVALCISSAVCIVCHSMHNEPSAYCPKCQHYMDALVQKETP